MNRRRHASKGLLQSALNLFRNVVRADVIAFMLQLNAYPAASAELTGAPAALSGIRIEPLKAH